MLTGKVGIYASHDPDLDVLVNYYRLVPVSLSPASFAQSSVTESLCALGGEPIIQAQIRTVHGDGREPTSLNLW